MSSVMIILNFIFSSFFYVEYEDNWIDEYFKWAEINLEDK